MEVDRHKPLISFPGEALLFLGRIGNPSSHQLMTHGAGCCGLAGHSSRCAGSVWFSLPTLCLAPGASMGFVGCLRIRDLVVNHFPHPRLFHSCPWDQRSSALEPCMGTAPARETAAELHVRDGERTSSVSRTLLLPLPPRNSLEGTTAASQKLTAKCKWGC